MMSQSVETDHITTQELCRRICQLIAVLWLFAFVCSWIYGMLKRYNLVAEKRYNFPSLESEFI